MKSLTLLPSSFPNSFLWFLLVLSLCCICFCNQSSDPVLCIPTERSALVDLKNNLTDHANHLTSWVGKDCCSWFGVVCDNITGHVHEIRLGGHKQVLEGTISPSIIQLVQLRHLDLSCNFFWFKSIPAFIGSFQNLVYLNLSYSGFQGEIPHQLGNLSTLRVLDLSQDEFLVPYSKSLIWLNNLEVLQHLDMSGIMLVEASDWFPAISNLTSLLELRFSDCLLGRLPSNPTTVSFTSLIVLDLSYNYFGCLFHEWIFSLGNLVLLDLTDCSFRGVNPGTHGGFHRMPSLRTLRVSSNHFVNSLPLNGLSSLHHLRFLDVSHCDIYSPILGYLHNLFSIEHIDLSYNRIVEEIPTSLSNLCNITTLDLQNNKFSGDVSEILEKFSECESPNVKLLAFRNNHLSGQLPKRIGKLKNLIHIDLGYNNLTRTVPYSLGSLSLLQTLDISINQLSGSIPYTIGGLSSLESLDLSYNNLNGSLPESIGRLGKLSSLHLDHNSFTSILTTTHFANLTTLKYLWVADNKLVIKLNANNWIPRFKLKVLRAGSCSLGPEFPSWIRTQTDLEELDVANANISGTIPNWIWTAFPSLYYLNMSNNNLQGKLIDGTLRGNFSAANFLDLSNNILSGSLEHFLCYGIQDPQLRVLNLANNKMSGVISDCWMNWQSLVILNLEKNQFSGIIPSSLGNISTLRSLDMDDNRLSGGLPLWLLNSISLVIIELAQNKLMGKIPTSIQRNNTSMRLLSLHSNKFEGKIPDELCHLRYLQILDLAHNNFSGNLPTCFANFSVMSGSPTFFFDGFFANSTTPDYQIISASLMTKGITYTYNTILYLVTLLDLSDNKFSGSIPDELVGLLGLRFINLSHNDLTGRIPNSFSHVGKLEALDLSMNHLDGNIPFSLSQLTALNWLNVSYNNLVGRIPTGRQLQTFSELSFTGNSLCGDPLPVCLQNIGDPKATTYGHDESNHIDWILVILALVGLVVGFWIILAPLLLSRRWRIAYYHFLEEILFKLQNFVFLLFLRLSKRCKWRSG